MKKLFLVILCVLLSSGLLGNLAGPGPALSFSQVTMYRDPSSAEPRAVLPETTFRVSITHSGGQANNTSLEPTISADGRYVAFSSLASNLVPGDDNNMRDIFVRDVVSNTIQRVSVSSGGAQANYGSISASISADGNFVVFASAATNLVANDTNYSGDIFVRNLLTNQTYRVSLNSNGQQINFDSYSPTISGDGRYVAFQTAAPIDSKDTNYLTDIYVRDRVLQTTRRISISSTGGDPNGNSAEAAISANGRFIAFVSTATNLTPGDSNGKADVFVYDRYTGQTARVSVHSNGTQANGHSGEPALSADGRWVAFSSDATNLVNSDTNGRTDVFLHDRSTGETRIISIGPGGVQGTDNSYNPTVVANGKGVVFDSKAPNLVAGDTNNAWDVFYYDRQTEFITRVSIAHDAAQANGDSDYSAVSANGQFIAFDSAATNLVIGDTSPLRDIFVHDRGGSQVRVIDEAGVGVPSAEVFHNGILFAQTDQTGQLVIPGLRVGDMLAARLRILEQPSPRAAHDLDSSQNWAYRVYITSLDIPLNGEPTPFSVSDVDAVQTLTLRKSNPLIGFNIVASLEWDATTAYLDMLRTGFRSASRYLYDVTNGQMLFEQVSIYDNKVNWASADYHFFANTTEHARANVNEIVSGSTTGYVYEGRYWDDPVTGAWDQPDGFRTHIHEFGHYGLGLYDSYIYWDNVNNREVKSNCTSPNIRNRALTSDLTNATIMDYQYNASEFAQQGVAGLWSPSCLLSRQWQKHAKSDWDFLVQQFSDKQAPARWVLKTPSTYGGVVAGPTSVPVNGWHNAVVVGNAKTGTCSPAPTIRAQTPTNAPIPNAQVVLRTPTGTLVAQGKTEADGRLAIVGAHNGDVIQVRGIYTNTAGVRVNYSRDTTIACTPGPERTSEAEGAVDDRTGQPGSLSRETPLSISLEEELFAVHVRILPTNLANQAAVEISATVPLSAAPTAAFQQVGAEQMTAIPLAYQAGTGVYRGTFSLNAALEPAGLVEVQAGSNQLSLRQVRAGAPVGRASQVLRLYYPFEFLRVNPQEETFEWVQGGAARLTIPAGAVSAAGRLSLAAVEFPAPPPVGQVVLVGPYQLLGEPGLVITGTIGVTLHYLDKGNWQPVSEAQAAVYQWTGAAWQALPTSLDFDLNTAAVSITDFGIFALFAPEAPPEAEWAVYLPLVVR